MAFFFTTLQKFEEESGLFSNRDDILVLVDEAHRSHYGLEKTLKFDFKSGKAYEKYGTAKYLHDALPKAIYIGFTGTPVETEDKSTSAIFGDVIDVYDMTQAILDGSTLPISYESRMARLGLDQNVLKEIDKYYVLVRKKRASSCDVINRSKQMLANISKVMENPHRLELIVKDIIFHYEERKNMVADHAMVVAYSRKSAYIMYKKFLELRPDYKDVVKMIVTPSNKDFVDMQKLIGTKSDNKRLEQKFKSEDAREKFKIAIVVDMWLTGFDVPKLGTMYIDKPMKAHNLMQAIARVNRVYKDKEGGLIVDYIGLKSWLFDALKIYTVRDQNKIKDVNDLQKLLLVKLDIIDDMFGNFDYSHFNFLDNTGKYNLIRKGANVMLATENSKKKFMDYSYDVKKLYTLCSGVIEDDVKEKCFFIVAVRSFISKITNVGKLDVFELNQNVGKMLEDAIVNDELLKLCEFTCKDSFKLLDNFTLKKFKNAKEKNIVSEVLFKVVKSSIDDMGKINLTMQEKFSTKFNKIVNFYNKRGNLADVDKVIEMMFDFKKKVDDEFTNGNKYNLSSLEKAYFDALCFDDEVKEVLDVNVLVQMARDLVKLISDNLTLDAFLREDGVARIRSSIRRLLIKNNYPSRKREVAVLKITRQADIKYR